MTYYDEQLQQLQEQAARARQLEAMRKELRSQRDTLADGAQATWQKLPPGWKKRASILFGVPMK